MKYMLQHLKKFTC